MATQGIYEPKYENSWALVIGINEYQHVNPLACTCNDANEIAETLRTKFGFPKKNVVLLTDKQATRQKVLSEFLSLADGKAGPDDRVVFFFAGHGYTRTGQRGEIGFLVPVEGNMKNIFSLIRWDELIRNAELIPAKHIFFIVDACYGGLAVQRRLSPGTMRFAKDMLLRRATQAVAAGKANEPVSDAGGPRSGHSVFTGHLLDALEGAAESDGVLTANTVMGYVYDRVARDHQSNQTPHFGTIDGDGDMILSDHVLTALAKETKGDTDVLFQIESGQSVSSDKMDPELLLKNVKEYLSDPRYLIRLHDLVSEEIRKVISEIGDKNFPVDSSERFSVDRFSERLAAYESSVKNLGSMAILIARWGGDAYRDTLRHLFARMAEAHDTHNGLVVWLGLRRYPLMYLMYLGGIAALSSENYENLYAIFATKVNESRYSGQISPNIILVSDAILDVDRTDAFKTLKGHENNYVPRSEYLYKTAQPLIEDTIYVGRDYERLFDTFEIFYALAVADFRSQTSEPRRIWGPPGRFAWKYSRGGGPFAQIVSEAEEQKDKWAPLRAGFFGGSYQRFRTVADAYTELLNGLRWF